MSNARGKVIDEFRREVVRLALLGVLSVGVGCGAKVPTAGQTPSAGGVLSGGATADCARCAPDDGVPEGCTLVNVSGWFTTLHCPSSERYSATFFTYEAVADCRNRMALSLRLPGSRAAGVARQPACARARELAGMTTDELTPEQAELFVSVLCRSAERGYTGDGAFFQDYEWSILSDPSLRAQAHDPVESVLGRESETCAFDAAYTLTWLFIGTIDPSDAPLLERLAACTTTSGEHEVLKMKVNAQAAVGLARIGGVHSAAAHLARLRTRHEERGDGYAAELLAQASSELDTIASMPLERFLEYWREATF